MVDTAQNQNSRVRRAVPDGIAAHRNAVRKTGGLLAVALSMIVMLIGFFLLILPGTLTGLLGFVLTVIAMPTLPLFGVPAADGLLPGRGPHPRCAPPRRLR